MQQQLCCGSQQLKIVFFDGGEGIDQILVELKKAVLKKSFEAFSKGEDSVLRYQVRLSVFNVDDLKE